jgi:2-polyprenyl-6-methoxyphenol hydroxylase-like FAD-dependent oxidoreductase
MDQRFERAAVLGAGVAGLAAAAALHPFCGQVVLVERDLLQRRPAPRRGLPQSHQLHNLLSGAQQSLERLVPGFCEALIARGAGTARVSDQTHVFELGERMPERDLGLRLMCAPRPEIDWVLNELVRALPRVLIYDGTRATGILVRSGHQAAGVTLDGPRGLETLDAELIVDATGAPSAASRWLAGAGVDPAGLEAIDVEQWYVSMRFARSEAWRDRDDFWMVFPTPPRSRGGLLCPSPNNEWHLSVSGRRHDPRPRTEAAVREYARSLEDPWLAEVLDGAAALSEPTVFSKPQARRYRYELLDRPLAGFLPIGDAVASLNPLFGQGMSVASQQAEALREVLGEHGEAATLTRAYLELAAGCAERAIGLGAAIESVIPDQHGFAARIKEDAALHRLYVRVWHLLEPADALRPYTGA